MSPRARRSAGSWLDPLARIGFAARGFVYILVGSLAAAAALGLGGRTTDAHGAIRTLERQPFGTVLLALVALGLLGYTVWRFAQAAVDLEDKGDGVKGLAVRATYAGSGVIHLGLAASAASLAIGFGSGRSDPVRTWTRRAMSEPYGRWLVLAAGLAVIGGAVYQFYKAWSRKFEDDLRTARMSETELGWARRIGRAGLCARGITFGLIGYFLVRAGLEYDAGQARGMGAALRALAQQDQGPWLLAAVGVGLAAYGMLSLVDARYRRII